MISDINIMYFNIINLFICVAIISDILNSTYNRILPLFILNYIIILLNTRYKPGDGFDGTESYTKEKQLKDNILKCTNIFFFIGLWFSIGISENLNILYYISTLPIISFLFYSNVTENKMSIGGPNYYILLYYIIICSLKNKSNLIYFKG